MPSNFIKTNENQQAFWANDILFHLGSLTHMYLHKQIVHLGSVSTDTANEYTLKGFSPEIDLWGGTVILPNTVGTKEENKIKQPTTTTKTQEGASSVW